MYAILKHGGHQYRVAPGDHLLVDRLTAEVGSTVTLEPVLLVADGDGASVGESAVAGARVLARVVAHRKGRKLRVFTYKPKKRHRRTLGFRAHLTELRIDELAGETPKAGRKRTAEPAAAKRGAAPEAAAPTGGAESGDAGTAKAPADERPTKPRTPRKRPAKAPAGSDDGA